MSAATDIAALRAELDETKKALADLRQTLEIYFEGLPQDQFVAWRKAKRAVVSGENETSDANVTVGKGLPLPPTKTLSNAIGL